MNIRTAALFYFEHSKNGRRTEWRMKNAEIYYSVLSVTITIKETLNSNVLVFTPKAPAD